MTQTQEPNLALFVDFDNVALGARDARQRFDIQLILQRLLEKGKIIVKRAYADWRHHKEYLQDMHQAGIELIEIPAPQLSGKNSADIRLVVDAMDMCYGKEHMNVFVIVSGDSDFTPLVSKLRENGKSVIGVGMRNSSSRLLIVNCDEFIFYDDLYSEQAGRQVAVLQNVPQKERELFDFLVTTIQGLMRESRGVLYSSLIKDTMKRKQPEFSEHEYGYSNFGDLLEDAMEHGLLEAVRDSRAGGTWVVTALGKAAGAEGNGPRRSRGRRRGRRRSENGGREGAAPAAFDDTAASATTAAAPAAPSEAGATGAPPPAADKEQPGATPARRRRASTRRRRSDSASPDTSAGAEDTVDVPREESADGEAKAAPKRAPRRRPSSRKPAAAGGRRRKPAGE